MSLQPTESCLIGFDVREDWLSFPDLWDESRAGLYLLKSDVKKPLSVDMNVWPTLLQENGTAPIVAYDISIDSFRGIEVSTDVNGNIPLFSSSEELIDAVRREWPFPDKPVLIVGISYFYDKSLMTSNSWPCINAVHENLMSSWEFLGYDVADAGLISGLLNCGYTLEEKNAAQHQWAKLLNGNHLFQDITAAQAFRIWTNARVIEHAPFCVYGLHAVCRIP